MIQKRIACSKHRDILNKDRIWYQAQTWGKITLYLSGMLSHLLIRELCVFDSRGRRNHVYWMLKCVILDILKRSYAPTQEAWKKFINDQLHTA